MAWYGDIESMLRSIASCSTPMGRSRSPGREGELDAFPAKAGDRIAERHRNLKIQHERFGGFLRLPVQPGIAEQRPVTL
ncbi:MAG TPA: hypothetical protein VFO01_07990 [Trebonia sp.]|nr:hypothetical protein [Trebonia sp.]